MQKYGCDAKPTSGIRKTLKQELGRDAICGDTIFQWFSHVKLGKTSIEDPSYRSVSYWANKPYENVKNFCLAIHGDRRQTISDIKDIIGIYNVQFMLTHIHGWTPRETTDRLQTLACLTFAGPGGDAADLAGVGASKSKKNLTHHWRWQ